MDNKNANLETDSGGTVQKVSEVSEDSIGNWARVYSRQSLTKSLAAFCLHMGNLGKAEIKSSDFLVEEIQKQDRTRGTAELLLTTMLTMRKQKGEQRDVRNAHFGEKEGINEV